MSIMSTIFTKIINREIPAHIVYEDDVCIVILDKFPAITGQTLIIPRNPVDYYFDLDDETLVHLLAVSKKIAKALDTVYQTLRTCLVIEGFEVPHVHIKLYPRTTVSHEWKGTEMASDETLATEAEKIRQALVMIDKL